MEIEITDALVTAIVRELLKRLNSGQISGSGTCSGSCGPAPKAPPVQGNSGRKRVISETEIIRLCPASAGIGQTVEIGLKDIITPLAEDYIAKLRITVNRIG